jgi:hypothetical protein
VRAVSFEEEKMDANALLGYASTLALLYAWTLIAAGAFAVAESVARGGLARRSAAVTTPDQIKR